MKKIIFTALLVSQSVLASHSSFKSDSLVPSQYQAQIIEAVAKKCRLVSETSLNEEQTTLTRIRVDQGIVDDQYTIILNGSYYFDGTHPLSTQIEVIATDYAGYNPSGLISIESISSVHTEACE